MHSGNRVPKCRHRPLRNALSVSWMCRDDLDQVEEPGAIVGTPMAASHRIEAPDQSVRESHPRLGVRGNRRTTLMGELVQRGRDSVSPLYVNTSALAHPRSLLPVGKASPCHSHARMGCHGPYPTN